MNEWRWNIKKWRTTRPLAVGIPFTNIFLYRRRIENFSNKGWTLTSDTGGEEKAKVETSSEEGTTICWLCLTQPFTFTDLLSPIIKTSNHTLLSLVHDNQQGSTTSSHDNNRNAPKRPIFRVSNCLAFLIGQNPTCKALISSPHLRMPAKR